MEKKYFLLLLSFLVLSSTIKAEDYDVASISLQEAVEIGVENNLAVKRSQLEHFNTESNLIEAQGQRLPSFSASASGRFNWGRSINPVTNLFEARRIGNINIGANANVTIFAGNQINNSIQQAKTNLEA